MGFVCVDFGFVCYSYLALVVWVGWFSFVCVGSGVGCLFLSLVFVVLVVLCLLFGLFCMMTCGCFIGLTWVWLVFEFWDFVVCFICTFRGCLWVLLLGVLF